MIALREVSMEPVKPMRASEQYDRLEWHLSNWALLIKSGGLSEFKVQGGHGIVGYTHYGDKETEDQKSDYRTAVMVDAIIRGLKQAEQDALATEYLMAAWMHYTDHHLVLLVARHGVQMGINRRGIY